MTRFIVEEDSEGRRVDWDGGNGSWVLGRRGSLVEMWLDGEVVGRWPQGVLDELATGLSLLRARPRRGRPDRPNAGKPWTTALDEELTQLYTVKGLASHFGRTEGAIRSRLVRIGLVEDRQSAH